MGSRRRLCSNLRTPRGSLRTTSLGWQFMMSLPLSSKQCCPAPVRNRRLPFVHSAFSLQREFPIVPWSSKLTKFCSIVLHRLTQIDFSVSDAKLPPFQDQMLACAIVYF